jgi:hypothetical protein
MSSLAVALRGEVGGLREHRESRMVTTRDRELIERRQSIIAALESEKNRHTIYGSWIASDPARTPLEMYRSK